MFDEYRYEEDERCLIHINSFGLVRIYDSINDVEKVFNLIDVVYYDCYKTNNGDKIFTVKFGWDDSLDFIIRNKHVVNVIHGYLSEALCRRSCNERSYKEMYRYIRDRVELLPKRYRKPFMEKIEALENLYEQR